MKTLNELYLLTSDEIEELKTESPDDLRDLYLTIINDYESYNPLMSVKKGADRAMKKGKYSRPQAIKAIKRIIDGSIPRLYNLKIYQILGKTDRIKLYNGVLNFIFED